MAISFSAPLWAVGLCTALALGGVALTVGVAGAQTAPAPPPGGALIIGCVAPAGAPGPEAGAVTFDAAVARSEFAAQLARALGRPQPEVERALAQAEAQVPPQQQVVAVGVVGEVHIEADLAPVAARLGVTVEELLEAMQAAAAPCPSAPPQAGVPQTIHLDPTAHFAAIAQKLGRGITGPQVQAAFEAFQPAGPPTEGLTIGPPVFLEALAKALGISVEQLKAALATIRPPGARP